MHKRQREHINLARYIAQKSLVRKSRHGCVIVGRRGRILASACNVLTKRRTACGQFTLHAEEVALHKIGARALRSVISVYVTRINGSHMYSRPCPRCTPRIAALGVPVYYTTM